VSAGLWTHSPVQLQTVQMVRISRCLVTDRFDVVNATPELSDAQSTGYNATIVVLACDVRFPELGGCRGFQGTKGWFPTRGPGLDRSPASGG
jgi:hypothetical protein